MVATVERLANDCTFLAQDIRDQRAAEHAAVVAIEEARRKIKEVESLLVDRGLNGKNERERAAELELSMAANNAVILARAEIAENERALSETRAKIEYEDRLFQVHLAVLRTFAAA